MVFVVIEGIDGCGKSTQAKKLVNWLKGQGKDAILTAEPTDNEIGEFIREVLSGSQNVDPKTLALLFTADRYEHLKNVVEPALSERKVVVSERYYHSTICYQEAQGVSRQWLLELNKFARKPDITIVLDVEPEMGAGRTTTQEIFENREFLEKVRENYMKFNDDVIKIDGEEPEDAVFSEIKKAVSERL